MMRVQQQVISDGKHYLSGVGYATMEDGYNNNDIDVDLFCIDGITYGAFLDPADGLRSYGCLRVMNDVKCQYTFQPQPVIVKNIHIDNTKDGADYTFYDMEIKSLVKITDAVNGKEALTVGTDYTDTFYPMAIFNYTPENLEVNRKR